jgi:hypothetical protein
MLTLNEWLEDFDNAELSEYERTEQLREAVIEFNEKNGTSYDPDKSVARYQAWQSRRHYEL